MKVGTRPGGIWHPVVFPDRCDGCPRLAKPACIKFCPNNVFALMSGKAEVVNPQNCVHGCVACRPVCPNKAIEFPQDGTLTQKVDRAWTEGLHKGTCKKCGKTFWSDEQKDLCPDCS